jgi:hypothetical protein
LSSAALDSPVKSRQGRATCNSKVVDPAVLASATYESSKTNGPGENVIDEEPTTTPETEASPIVAARDIPERGFNGSINMLQEYQASPVTC